MASRTYNRTLKCGCMISSDGGGGIIPCCYDEASEKEIWKCSKAWKEGKKTEDYQEHLREIQEKNN